MVAPRRGVVDSLAATNVMSSRRPLALDTSARVGNVMLITLMNPTTAATMRRPVAGVPVNSARRRYPSGKLTCVGSG